ncbi:MAG TPA: 3-hydroxyacyl-CoA dehydrogenase NAD-binding domain-containing protein, partial [Solirubrobacterales bacterium]|nr:3-hydroxyacyl-CoA dehydrogenase NAD-binding domain-containing protein [Solirubrobacterales bacterium]
GVVGAGTMGAGIAQIAALGGYETHLYEIDEKQLARGLELLRDSVRRGAERGRWSETEAAEALERIRTDTLIEVLGDCELVIEAAPEDLELKRNLFERLASVCGPDAVLATNTSSLSVAAIASAVPEPRRIVGMHFFNPPALMQLVEIVAGDESGEAALELATEVGRGMGRTPIRARDSVGFVANRCVRPFFLESLRMLSEEIAPHDEIDRIVRLGAGLRMGPFELMDLIGIDVNFAVARSFWEQSFGEPRWRPVPLHARMVASGRLGRKTGRGFYPYETDEPHRPRDPEIEADRPIFDEDELEEVAGSNAPAVLTRLGATIANEACFALGERVASADDINTAMRLGYNWPIGSLEWGERLGWSRALGVLEELRELQGEAYRPAALLRERAGG